MASGGAEVILIWESAVITVGRAVVPSPRELSCVRWRALGIESEWAGDKMAVGASGKPLAKPKALPDRECCGCSNCPRSQGGALWDVCPLQLSVRDGQV